MNLWLIAGHFGHALAAILCASLAIHLSRQPNTIARAQWFIVALALTALWALRHAFVGASPLGQLWDGATETLRNAAWLAALAVHLRDRQALDQSDGRRILVVGALAVVLLVQLALDLMVVEGAPVSAQLLPLFNASWMLRCAFALGALYVLYGWTTRRDNPVAARREAWVGAALACMWAYDFNHYMLAWLTDGRATPIAPMRGVVMALLATMLALGLRSDGTREFALSRALLSKMIPAAVVALYVLVVVLLVGLITDIGGAIGRIILFSLLFGLAVAVLAFLPSASMRSWLRAEISKHVFAHRYDYRALWLKFAAAMDASGTDARPLDARITTAIAEAVEAPAAALYSCDADGAFILSCTHGWADEASLPKTLPAALARQMTAPGWVIDIAADWRKVKSLLPAWMQHDRSTWAISPLVHGETIVGAVLLATPPARQGVDWEDQDLLRVVCGEAAARISEDRNRTALAEAQRFDEFNRRFAFILHDLKNLVSQMTLLARNARRHAENPDFRRDMILTIEETAARTSDLLQRLNRPGATSPGEPVDLLIGPWIDERVRGWSAGLGVVQVEGDVDRAVRIDADGLDRALAHLVRNAIDASRGAPVTLRIDADELGVAIHVIDQGEGMDEAFISNELFRPFSSTKPDGFGLGAHEARLLIEAMGGNLTVTSSVGEGSCFTVRLPFAVRAVGESAAEPARDRKVG